MGEYVVLTGSPSENEYVESVVAEVKNKELTESLSGKLTFGEFMELIERSFAVITNDTGPMHLAAALGKPMVALFGPGDPLHYELPSAKTITIVHHVACSPCLYHSDVPPCKGNNICMQKITVSEVVEAFAKVTHHEFHSPPKGTKTAFSTHCGSPLGHICRRSVNDGPKCAL